MLIRIAHPKGHEYRRLFPSHLHVASKSASFCGSKQLPALLSLVGVLLGAKEVTTLENFTFERHIQESLHGGNELDNFNCHNTPESGCSQFRKKILKG